MADSQDLWTAVEQYVTSMILAEDPALDAALAASADAGLPVIQVSPSEGAFLSLIARLQHARSILEIGTLGGYSTIWMGRALAAGGRLVTLEVDQGYAALARANVDRAGLAHVVEVRIGPAADSLEQMVAGNEGPFDLVFIDADKKSTPQYFELALHMCRPGSVIIVDNVVRKGTLIEAESEDPDVLGMRQFLERVSAEPRVTATVLQTVGTKGYDGFAFILVNS